MFSAHRDFCRRSGGCCLWLSFVAFASIVTSTSLAEDVTTVPAADMEPGAAVSAPFKISVSSINERIRSSNPRLLFENETVQRALEQSYQSRAELLPQLSLELDQRRTQFARGFAGDSFRSPPFNSFTADIVGTMNLLSTEAYAAYRIDKLGALIAEQEYAVAVQDILEQCIQTYFTHLRNLRAFDIVTANIERKQALLDLARDRYEAGAAIKIDVTRAEVGLASERRSLMEAETAIANTILQLKALLDLDFDQEVVVDRSIVDAGLKAPPSLKKYSAQKTLAETRPELISQEMLLKQAKLARKAADWQRLPTISLYGQWGYESDVIFDGDEEEGWLIGIQASVPIFEGFRIAAERREADAAVRQNTYAMRELRNEIEREFRYAMIEMDSRYDQIAIARDEIRLGRDEVQQAQERYSEGLADNRELIDAQDRLSEAESSELRAVYLYGLSRLAFARSIGAAERVLD